MLWKCLDDILELVKTEDFFVNKSPIGYDLPDGKHHLFIYVDDSYKREVIVIEPNLINADGTHEPCGDNGLCGTDNTDAFIVEVAWVIETQCV